MSTFEAARAMALPVGAASSQDLGLEDQLLLHDWLLSSTFLFYAVLLVSALTLPLLIGSWATMQTHRKTQYYPYLVSIIYGNFVLLATVLANVIMENTHVFSGVFPGAIVCKLSAFLVNASSCFIHWSWVAMYLQRFLHVFFPMRSRRRYPKNTWITILVYVSLNIHYNWRAVAQQVVCLSTVHRVTMGNHDFKIPSRHTQGRICHWSQSTDYHQDRTSANRLGAPTPLKRISTFSVISQLWTPILITELHFGSDETNGTYCAEDPHLAGSTSLKTLVLAECVLTFFLPLGLTAFTDISVLLVLRSSCQPQFTLISADELCHEIPTDATTMKIVSKTHRQCAEKRRSNAIRRCLWTATVTLLLNLPNYSLQLIDEFYHLRDSAEYNTRRLFLKIDAGVYILYLLQFPIVPIYMQMIRGDLAKSSRKQKKPPIPLRMDHSRSTFSVG
ncbi:unnamed protein product [Caenorhabditis auriculariae]|uniref:G-protein coupled receptors family 1 profile domain-containing protein n=1 Tax=Caenorhabditis auriculariae TaxID=2777116 RepID=A0A8S1HCB3_9PELO|nr:unnamed protein product [Caenorhabditis auriculariae]